MGLDMYLFKETYVGAEYKHRKVNLKIEGTVDGEEIKIDPEKVSTIRERVGYWRKANHIHKYFIDQCNKGKDDCREFLVSCAELDKLRGLCKTVLTNRDKEFAAKILPTCSGFFFGSTEYDESYYQGLKETIEIIDSLDLSNGDYFYRASW